MLCLVISALASANEGFAIDLSDILPPDGSEEQSELVVDVFVQSPALAEPATIEQTSSEPTDSIIVDVVEVNEAFYRVRYDAESGNFVRRQTQEAGPGDIIEVVVTATNKGNVVVHNIQMVHSLPRGPVELLEDSITINEATSSYRISQTGITFFPPEAEIPAQNIRFIEWQLLTIPVGSTETLSYRIRIKP